MPKNEVLKAVIAESALFIWQIINNKKEGIEINRIKLN